MANSPMTIPRDPYTPSGLGAYSSSAEICGRAPSYSKITPVAMPTALRRGTFNQTGAASDARIVRHEFYVSPFSL